MCCLLLCALNVGIIISQNKAEVLKRGLSSDYIYILLFLREKQKKRLKTDTKTKFKEQNGLYD